MPLNEPVYMAGSFNNWNPADEAGKLKKDSSGKFYIDIEHVKTGDSQFKFTRGSWSTVETTSEGIDINNRVVTIQSDTTFNFIIAGWKTAPTKEKMHTASKNVRIADTAFLVPQLNRTRRIWVYLPENYVSSRHKYPVLYMQDGQNLFDAATSFSGEWGVDEELDSLHASCLVIGIDNGGMQRMTEYNPNDNDQFGKGEGRQYLEFIVKTLKPFIDKNYRTLKSKKNTFIAGSSMGGLISFYAGLYYPKIFGAIGVFSPAFWITPKLDDEIKAIAKKKTYSQQRYFFYAGGAEAQNMVSDMLNICEKMRKYSNPLIEVVIKPEGQHNEYTWGKEFPGFYKWAIKK